MAIELKQSTSWTGPVGPFLDESDGITPETGLTISQADIRLKKNGGAWAQSNDATGATHEEGGWYELTLDATDTNTLGVLKLSIQESGAVPVWENFLVVSANYWDHKYGTANLNANAVAISGDTTAADNLEAAYDGAGYAGGTIKQIVDVGAISGDTTAADNCELMFDGTGYAGGTTKLGVDIVSISGDTTAADNAELMFDGTGYAGGTTKLVTNLSSAGLDSVVPRTGLTGKTALGYIVDAAAGLISGVGTGTVVVKDAGDQTTTRITATTDAIGNRTAVTLG